MSEKFKLMWETFQVHTKKLFHELLATSNYADVTLVCDDQTKFKVHKFILAACSSVFKSIFETEPVQSLIFLRGIQNKQMKMILEFMYSGQVEIPKDEMEEFLSVAKSLQVTEIFKIDTFDEDKTVEEFYKSQKEVLEKVNDEKEELYSCKLCEYVGKSTPALKYHVDAKHKDIKHGCEECGQLFTSLGGVSNHKKNVHEINERNCNKCDFKTTKPSTFYQHMKNIHDQAKHSCKECYFETTKSSTFYLHINSVHKGKKYPCKKCPKEFIISSDLNKHVQRKHQKGEEVKPKCDLKPNVNKRKTEETPFVKFTNSLFD